MSSADFLASLPVIVAVVGPVGSLIELLGESFGCKPVADFGRGLESLGVDLPKTVTNLVGVLRALGGVK
jgi:hypothetical protein